MLGDADGLEVEFTEEVVGNRSPIESPLMDAIGDWVGEADPAGEAVPVVLPAFTDSRWFRAAFPDCVAYGFFPQRHQDLYETWPLMHSADERIDVRDLGFAAEFFADSPGGCWDDADADPPSRRSCASAGWRCATGCSSTGRPTGPPRCARARARSKVASGRKPRLRAVDASPACAASSRLAEAFVVIPLVKRALPEARLPFQDPGVLAVAAGASLAGTLLRRRAARRRRRGGRGGVVASCPRCSRCAAASSPPTTGSSTRRSPPTRRTTRTPPTPRRSTTAAARTSSRRCSPPTWPARCCCAAPRAPGALAGGAVALASTAVAVEVFAWCERNAETRLARALSGPGFEIQRLVGTREPDERQLEVGRAALAEILRVEGASGHR